MPDEEEFASLRYYIEAVKTNIYSPETLSGFIDFLNQQPSGNLVLGCTEFPVIWSKIKAQVEYETRLTVYDPLESVLDVLHAEFLQNKI